MPKTLYLEDIAVGDQFKSSTFTLTAENIKAFAHEYDPQPFHLDEDAAQESFFQGLAASGWQTACITMRLMVESIPVAGGLIGAACALQWPQPSRPGDILHIEVEVIEIRPSHSKPDRAVVTAQIDTLNQRGEYAQRMQCRMVVFKRNAKS